MAYGLTFRLELEDGTLADPPTFRCAPGVSWEPGDTSRLVATGSSVSGWDRTARVRLSQRSTPETRSGSPPVPSLRWHGVP
jgi:hypothetical protein